jgi:hypothetical protein
MSESKGLGLTVTPSMIDVDGQLMTLEEISPACLVRHKLGGFVKIVVVSDIHANPAALEALPERNFDQLWCIGDLVDYGPRPHEVVQWVKRNADLAVRGNHDHAAGFAVDPQCPQPFRRLAAETLNYTLEACTKEDLKFLRNLPLYRETRV